MHQDSIDRLVASNPQRLRKQEEGPDADLRLFVEDTEYEGSAQWREKIKALVSTGKEEPIGVPPKKRQRTE